MPLTPCRSARTPKTFAAAVTALDTPAPTALLNWQAQGNSSSTLYFKGNLADTNWVVVTNVTQGPITGPITVTDPVKEPWSRVITRVKVAT